MKYVFLLTVIMLSVACGSPTSNKTSTPSVDALTPEEQLSQRIREWTDSINKAHLYFQQNLGSILPEWAQDIDQKREILSIGSDKEKLKYFYSLWEYSATVSARNKQLKNQFYDIPDTQLKDDALRDIGQSKEQLGLFSTLRLLFAQDCKKSYWIDDIDVEVSGKRSQYLRFIGSQFSRNKHIQEFHDEISETCEVLRFEQVGYSRYDGAGWECFVVYEGKDSDPIPTILDWQYQWGVFPNTF